MHIFILEQDDAHITFEQFLHLVSLVNLVSVSFNSYRISEEIPLQQARRLFFSRSWHGQCSFI